MKTELKFVGIDVSKNTLDICILDDQPKPIVVKNNKKAITKFFKTLSKNGLNNYHICAENTGKYTWLLMRIASELDLNLYIINPLHLKRSLGLVRGKNDKIDAIRITHFIKKNHNEMSTYIAKRDIIEDLQILLSERRFKVLQRKQLKTKNKELLVLSNRQLAKIIQKQNNQLLKLLNKQITDIEKQINARIEADVKLKALHKQLTSIPGVGNILSWNMIVKTNEFKSITDPRKLACYAGVAPFQNTSGISVFGRNRVSNFADKSLKKLLHMGALSAIRLQNDLAIYYNRKVNEGKNKMSVLNAVRNKIIHIIFALIKNQTFYKNRLVTS